MTSHNDEPCVCGTDFTCLADHEATVWCIECDGAADVVEADWQADPQELDWWVRRLDCGHEEVEVARPKTYKTF